MQRQALAILGSLLGLGGCAATSQGAPGASALPPLAARLHANAGRSWMLPDAKKHQLLYVSDPGNNTVNVYVYPKGTPAGVLTGFNEPWGLCSDRHGNVFIADVWNYRVVEFAHGGTSPIASVDDGDGHPENCSVDGSSGNLAVAYYFLNDPSKASEVAVYAGAQGTPRRYGGSKIGDDFWACAYDDSGNLFADGAYGLVSTAVGLAELRKGARHFTDITLGTHVQFLSGIQWTGKYLAMGDQSQGSYPARIYRFAVSGSSTTLVDTTQLDNTRSFQQFAVHHGKVAAAGEYSGAVALYRYPAGGEETKSIGGLKDPFGVAVSLPQ